MFNRRAMTRRPKPEAPMVVELDPRIVPSTVDLTNDPVSGSLIIKYEASPEVANWLKITLVNDVITLDDEREIAEGIVILGGGFSRIDADTVWISDPSISRIDVNMKDWDDVVDIMDSDSARLHTAGSLGDGEDKFYGGYGHDSIDGGAARDILQGAP